MVDSVGLRGPVAGSGIHSSALEWHHTRTCGVRVWNDLQVNDRATRELFFFRHDYRSKCNSACRLLWMRMPLQHPLSKHLTGNFQQHMDT